MTGLKMTFFHHLQVTPEGVPHEDVVVVQPLLCLNEVCGGTRQKYLRQCPGSALTKLFRSFTSFPRLNCGPCTRRGRRICPLIVYDPRCASPSKAKVTSLGQDGSDLFWCLVRDNNERHIQAEPIQTDPESSTNSTSACQDDWTMTTLATS